MNYNIVIRQHGKGFVTETRAFPNTPQVNEPVRCGDARMFSASDKEEFLEHAFALGVDCNQYYDDAIVKIEKERIDACAALTDFIRRVRSGEFDHMF
jgi:hypothetical protein